MKLYIKPIHKEELEEYLKVEDLSVEESNHAVALLYRKIREYIKSMHKDSMVKEYRLSPIVRVEDNYDNLLISKNNISRCSTYTHYVDMTHVLRAHTTAHIPKILNELASVKESWEDVIILLPGLVYRRDVTDKKHLGVIHQIEIWRVVKNSARRIIKREDLLKTINGLSETCASGWNKRNVDKIHPYTLEGIEVNLVKEDKDVEILEGGVINPKILQNAGLNPDEYSGWALGAGLDRLVMVLKDIPDIRYLRSKNSRIAVQMLDLLPYKEVSLMPAIKRDMSYCVPDHYVEEDIHQEIREALGDDYGIIESIEIIQVIRSGELSESVRNRLGCEINMKNILVRITLRHLEKTLTKAEANILYEKIYKKVNYGNSIYV